MDKTKQLTTQIKTIINILDKEYTNDIKESIFQFIFK